MIDDEHKSRYMSKHQKVRINGGRQLNAILVSLSIETHVAKLQLAGQLNSPYHSLNKSFTVLASPSSLLIFASSTGHLGAPHLCYGPAKCQLSPTLHTCTITSILGTFIFIFIYSLWYEGRSIKFIEHTLVYWYHSLIFRKGRGFDDGTFCKMLA